MFLWVALHAQESSPAKHSETSTIRFEEIADKLYVSQSTVKTHAARAMMKLAARDRAQLVVLAFEAGLVGPGR